MVWLVVPLDQYIHQSTCPCHVYHSCGLADEHRGRVGSETIAASTKFSLVDQHKKHKSWQNCFIWNLLLPICCRDVVASWQRPSWGRQIRCEFWRNDVPADLEGSTQLPRILWSADTPVACTIAPTKVATFVSWPVDCQRVSMAFSSWSSVSFTAPSSKQFASSRLWTKHDEVVLYEDVLFKTSERYSHVLSFRGRFSSATAGLWRNGDNLVWID